MTPMMWLTGGVIAVFSAFGLAVLLAEAWYEEKDHGWDNVPVKEVEDE